MIAEGLVLVEAGERLDHGGKEARSSGSGSAAAGGQAAVLHSWDCCSNNTISAWDTTVQSVCSLQASCIPPGKAKHLHFGV